MNNACTCAGHDIIQQPADFNTLTPRYTQETLTLLDKFAQASSQHSPVGALVSPCFCADAMRCPGVQTKQPFFIHVAYEEPHVPLFASPSEKSLSLPALLDIAS